MKIVVNNKTIFAEILSEATNEFRQLLITNAGKKGVEYEFKIEEAGKTQNADLRDWEKARTAANSNSKDKKDAAAPLYLKCPPRAIQTWIIK